MDDALYDELKTYLQSHPWDAEMVTCQFEEHFMHRVDFFGWLQESVDCESMTLADVVRVGSQARHFDLKDDYVYVDCYQGEIYEVWSTTEKAYLEYCVEDFIDNLDWYIKEITAHKNWGDVFSDGLKSILIRHRRM